MATPQSPTNNVGLYAFEVLGEDTVHGKNGYRISVLSDRFRVDCWLVRFWNEGRFQSAVWKEAVMEGDGIGQDLAPCIATVTNPFPECPLSETFDFLFSIRYRMERQYDRDGWQPFLEFCSENLVTSETLKEAKTRWAMRQLEG